MEWSGEGFLLVCRWDSLMPAVRSQFSEVLTSEERIYPLAGLVRRVPSRRVSMLDCVRVFRVQSSCARAMGSDVDSSS